MKTIKLIGMCILAAVLGMSVQSCSKDDYQSRIKELIINENNYKFDSDGGSYKREYRGEDLSCFKVSSNADWCTATIDFAKSTMTVTVDENETFDPRTATVTISDVVDGVSKRTFTVSQAQCDAIQTGEGTYEVGTNGGTVSISVKSNVSYKVQISYTDKDNKDWITVLTSKTRGLVESTLKLEVAKNTSQKERSATVRIYDEKSGVEDQVLITQKFVAKFDLEKTEYEIDEHGGTVDIRVTTNADFACYETPEDTWAKKQARQTISDEVKSQPFLIAPFTEKKLKRETSITFSNDFGAEEEVTITQTHNLYIEDESVTLMKGEAKELTLVNAKKWNVKWTSSDEKIATVDETGKLTGVDAGNAFITVTSEDGNHTDQIGVTVEKPIDLSSNLEGSNEPGYEAVEGVKVMTSLDCTITNKSENTIQLDEVSLYCDGQYLKSKALNRSLNKDGGSYTYTFPIDVEYETVPASTDDSSSETKAGSRADTDTATGSEETKKPKENTHKYYVVWDYTYGGEKFKFTYPEQKASTEKASTRGRRYTRR